MEALILRDRSTAKSFTGVDSNIAHRSTCRIVHKSNPASGGPDSRDRLTAHPSGLSNPSDKIEGAFTKGHHPPGPTSDYPPTTPSRPTPHTWLERLDSRLTPQQRRRLKTLRKRDSVKSETLPPHPINSSETRETPSPAPHFPVDIDIESSSKHFKVISSPSNSGSPASPDLTTPRSLSPDRIISPTTTMGTVKDLAEALTEKLKDIGRHQLSPSPNLEAKREKIQMIIV